MHIANLLETQSIIFYTSKTQEMLLNDNNIIKIGKIQKSSLFFKKRKKFFQKNIDWKKAEEILSRACQEEGAKSHD
jgi:hypothetical protein